MSTPNLFALPEQLRTALPASVLLGQMWWYAASVLYPAQALRRLGRYRPGAIGTLPPPIAGGQGVRFSRAVTAPCLLADATEVDASIRYFDTIATVYDIYLQAFTRPIYEEAAHILRPLLPRDARVLDAGCGPGTETLLLTRLVPEGEVVGIDLAAGMVQTAFDSARRRGVRNVAFYQADVARLPDEFAAGFDAVFSFGAFHHYPDPAAAVREMRRVLIPGGRACVVDPGPAWFKAISSPWAKWADPGWVGFYTGEEMRAFFTDAGFASFYWREVLPGFGLSIACT
ncbi:MAG: methyltransferase domain-containing protein [Deltaproteobacteria bacterium]|nr:methyltransferase domain-containing protein [Deltaproteobacteria bacterium]